MALKKNPALAYYKETGDKQAPNFATTALRLLRLVSEDLNSNFQRDESNEVRGDAQSSGSTITNVSSGGSIQLQYSLDTYDDLLVGMLYAPSGGTGREDGWRCDGFTPEATVMAGGAGDVTFDATDMTFTSSQLFAVLSAGDRIYVTGFGNKNLDTIWQVATGSTSSIIELENDTGAADIATYAGVSANVVGTGILIRSVQGYARNGTNERKFGFVRFYSDTDLAGETSTSGLNAVDWSVFRGNIAVSIQLAVAPGTAGWTGTLAIIGADETSITDATSASNIGGFQVANWDDVKVVNSLPLANAIQSVVMVRLRKTTAAVTAATRVDPLSFNINVSNNASEISATRNRGAIDINQGTFSVSVAMSLLYIDATYHNAMIADDAYEVEIGVADSTGNCQLWRFPKGRLTSERPNPGKNNPIQQNLTFTCEAGGDGYVGSAGAGRQVEILRFYAAAA